MHRIRSSSPSTTQTRAHFLGLPLAFTLASAAALAQTPQLVQIRAGSPLDDQATSYLYAIQSGLFKRNGLNASIEAAMNGSASAAGVIGGSYEVGQSSVSSLCAAHARGLPLVLVAPAALFEASATGVGLIVRNDSPINSPADLAGKTITVSALNDYFSWVVRAWADGHGADSTTVKLVEVPMTSSASAVVAGRVDGAVLAEPFLGAALATKTVRSIGNPGGAIGSTYIISAWFMSKDYVSKNSDVVQRFIRVMRDAQTYTNAHHAETAPLLARFTKIESSTPVNRVTQAVKFDLALIQPLIDSAARYKVIPARFDARDFIYPAALRS